MTFLLYRTVSLSTIRKGSKGETVRLWQAFLIDQSLLGGTPDGDFGRKTDTATENYQRQVGLKPDGIVGRQTYAVALADGFATPLETIGLEELRLGSDGEVVERWQEFLVGQNLLFASVSGYFDESTQIATQDYQLTHGLEETGMVDRLTYSKALADGYAFSLGSDEYPPKPDFPPLYNTAARQRVFGKFEYSHTPTKRNKEKITVHGNWAAKNIVKVVIPQLKGVRRYKLDGDVLTSGIMHFHHRAVPQLKALWQAWEAQGLRDLILTYGGSYVARYVRGSTRTLSNHAFGTAFDINIGWNRLGHEPAPKGTLGSVVELVSIANDYGFYWGGHFKRRDGMHFEVGKILSQSELDQLAIKYGMAQPQPEGTDDEPGSGSFWDIFF